MTLLDLANIRAIADSAEESGHLVGAMAIRDLLAEVQRLRVDAAALDRCIRAEMRFSRDGHGGVPFAEKPRWQDGHETCRRGVYRVLNAARADAAVGPPPTLNGNAGNESGQVHDE